jgi:hypothetical protein
MVPATEGILGYFGVSIFNDLLSVHHITTLPSRLMSWDCVNFVAILSFLVCNFEMESTFVDWNFTWASPWIHLWFDCPFLFFHSSTNCLLIWCDVVHKISCFELYFLICIVYQLANSLRSNKQITWFFFFFFEFTKEFVTSLLQPSSLSLHLLEALHVHNN